MTVYFSEKFTTLTRKKIKKFLKTNLIYFWEIAASFREILYKHSGRIFGIIK